VTPRVSDVTVALEPVDVTAVTHVCPPSMLCSILVEVEVGAFVHVNVADEPEETIERFVGVLKLGAMTVDAALALQPPSPTMFAAATLK
jgi:hypothetical protein